MRAASGSPTVYVRGYYAPEAVRGGFGRLYGTSRVARQSPCQPRIAGKCATYAPNYVGTGNHWPEGGEGFPSIVRLFEPIHDLSDIPFVGFATVRICGNGRSARKLTSISSIVPATLSAQTYTEWRRPLLRNASCRSIPLTQRDMPLRLQTWRLQQMGNGWRFRPLKWATSSSETPHCRDGVRQSLARPKFVLAKSCPQPLRSENQGDGTQPRWLR